MRAFRAADHDFQHLWFGNKLGISSRRRGRGEAGGAGGKRARVRFSVAMNGGSISLSLLPSEYEKGQREKYGEKRQICV